MVELESSSPEETERIAGEVVSGLEAGDVVTVSGDLGTGKTTFVRGACRALGVTSTVTSPTYAIGHRYRGRTDVSHLDLYRFEAMTESDWADLEAYFEDAVVFVEWPEAAEAYLPFVRARVRLRHVEADRRLISVESEGKSLQMATSVTC
jgi:tRNA threonylcarbamoyladenosine biosynthesis protein TsaE